MESNMILKTNERKAFLLKGLLLLIVIIYFSLNGFPQSNKFAKSNQPTLNLKGTYTADTYGYSDETVIYFTPKTDTVFDKKTDAIEN